MQIDGYTNDGDVGHQQGGQHQLPDREIKNAVLQYQGGVASQNSATGAWRRFNHVLSQKNHNSRKYGSSVVPAAAYNVRQFTLRNHNPR